MGRPRALLQCEALKLTDKKMSIRHTTRRKSARFIPVHRLAWLLLISFAVVVACFVGLHHRLVQPIDQGAQSASSNFVIPSPNLPSGHPQRTVYPYSVIPGGIRNVAELKSAIANDPIVSAHYGELQIANLRVIRLDRARSLHVSYRIGDRIYWTKGRMELAKGETVITDGVLMARTRCGNLAADVIPGGDQPATLLVEPTMETLDTPMNSPGADIPTDSIPPESFLTPPDFPVLPAGPGSSFGGGTTVISSPGGSTGPGSTSPGTGPSGSHPVVPVPEPGSLALLSIGLLGIILLRKLV
jgi:hypothetical protein